MSIEPSPVASRRRRRWAIPLSSLAIAALVGSAWLRIDRDRRLHSELDEARREVDRGHFSRAGRRLERLAGYRSVRDEANYLLGICEEGRGRFQGALAAWERVPLGSEHGPAAALRASRAEVGLGRYARAEETLDALIRAGGATAPEARRELAKLLRYEVRLDELRQLLSDGWRAEPDPALALREIALLDFEPVPAGAVQVNLERAGREAPDDDRVWLGRANLATRTGKLDEADRWLSRCLERRPRDPAVWLARLDWARSTGRPEPASRALEILGDRWIPPRERLDLLAWASAYRGDSGEERAALENLAEREPGSTPALDRLAELAARAGQTDQLGRLRREKARIDELKESYQEALARLKRSENLDDLARLAEALGRRFEAAGWASLALIRRPGDAEARARMARLDATERPSPTVAELIAKLRASESRHGEDGGESAGVVPTFVDDAEAAGLRFVYEPGRSDLHQLPEAMGGGVALLDYDGDGWLDLYAVQGGPFPPETQARPSADRLFRNRGDGTFEDATAASGLGAMPGGYGEGVAVGDYDGDGHPDLLVTRWRSYALYRNKGDGTFEDATERAGLSGNRGWPTSAAFADLDNDGDLDLYVCHYVAWDPDHPRTCRHPYRPGYTTCEPRPSEAAKDHLLRNDGGKFVDVTDSSGIIDRDGRGLGVIAADLNGDGLIDLFVANDTTANFLFRNLGGMRFEEVGHSVGVAANAEGGYQAGMGVACGDLDGDGRPDLAVTNYFGEATTFYANLGGGLFADHTAEVGLAAPSRYLLGFGLAFADFNDDGRLDLASANGHVDDLRPVYPFAMPAQLLLGGPRGRLNDATRRAGAAWSVERVGRGLAVGDLDNDGRMDLVLVAQGGPLAYFRNTTAGGGRSITLRLEGAESNRDAVGATVVVEAGGHRQVLQRCGGGSYLSASDPRLHVGVGGSNRVESIEVRWPSGRVERWRGLAADAIYAIREGRAEAEPIARYAGRR